MNIIDTAKFQAGVSVVPIRGHDGDKVPVAIGKLGTSAGGRGFVSRNIGGVMTTLALTVLFAGDAKGMFAEGEVSYPIKVSDRMLVVPGVRPTWAARQ